MKNEKIMILEMVNNGTITVDDAVKLLNALNKNSSNCFEDFAQDVKYTINSIPMPDAEKIKENANTFLNKTGDLFDDIANSFKDFFTPAKPTNENSDEVKEETINKKDDLSNNSN